MLIHVITLFPGMFHGPLHESILKRAQERGLLEVHLWNLRDFTTDKHHITDDYPYGGGPGMVMKPEPLFAAVEYILSQGPALSLSKGPQRESTPPVILMSPQGEPFTQEIAQHLAGTPELLLICGHYQGVDERVRQHLVTRELSIGDYVLTGGELPAMVVIDAVARLLPGVVGSEDSVTEDSFTSGLLQYPLYTRPADFRGWKVPEVLLSGDHAAVAKWRRQQALLRTKARRPELLKYLELTPEERRWLESQPEGPTTPPPPGDGGA